MKAFTLEEMAVAYLVPGGRGAAQAPRNLQTGYMWGHFEDAATIPRTLLTFYEAGRNPELAEQNARQLGTSLQRLRLDYPGFSIRVPIALGLVLLLPSPDAETASAQHSPSRVRASSSRAAGRRSRATIRSATWCTVRHSYRSCGWVEWEWRPSSSSGTRRRPGTWIRRLSVLGIALGMMLWPTNPVGLVQLEQRLDPVAMGGGQEHEVAEWGREHMESGDLLLDTSWMMQALLLSGTHTVARAPNAYPPGVPPGRRARGASHVPGRRSAHLRGGTTRW